MRSALIVLTVLTGELTSSVAAARADAEISVAPDLRGYLTVVPDAFVMGNEAYLVSGFEVTPSKVTTFGG